RFEVRTATTGYDAGMVTREFRPDVILLDYMLPDINGNVVCERIKSDPELQDTRVILISGAVRRDEIDGLLAAGAEEFIAKPFQAVDLVDKLLAYATA
ncbi:MAG: response regulator, partial [Phycisphaerales bacterium]|nr:response regulator [Phycisphaerales bacterium]